jgi:hypothetical protein
MDLGSGVGKGGDGWSGVEWYILDSGAGYGITGLGR